MAANLTTATPILKTLYPSDEVLDLVYDKNPAFAMLSKKGGFVGDSMYVPIIYGDSQSASSSMSVAQAQAALTSAKSIRFQLFRKKQYGVMTIDGETVMATENDEGAFVEALELEVDSVLHNMNRRLGIYAYGDGFGAVGQIASSGGISGSTITLQNPDDVTNFEKDQRIIFSASNAANQLRNTGGTTVNTITAIKRGSSTNGVASVLTFANAISTVTGTANGDFMFFEGDRQDSATPARLVMCGFGGYLPVTAPSASENFLGVDRSVDVNRLAGVRIDGSSSMPEELLIEMCNQANINGGSITNVFCNNKFWTGLVKAIGARSYVEMVTTQVTPKIGFKGMAVQGADGVVVVTPDRNCPSGQAYGIDLDVWKLHHLGDVVHTIEQDGLVLLRQASSDGLEGRYRHMGEIACRAPGRNVVAFGL